MAISVDWPTKVITIPQADLTFISGTLYELDTDVFRLELKALEASEYGMTWLDTHQHNTEVTVAGVTYARQIEIINGYTVTFEDGQYAVRLVGSNNNIFDEGIINRNQVSIIPTNSAGLINNTVVRLQKLLQNRMVTSPATGKITVYDDDDTTVLLEANLYEDADGTVPYRGQGSERRDRMQ